MVRRSLLAIALTVYLPAVDRLFADPASDTDSENLELPQPTEPSEAERTIAVQGSFRVELVAAEPLVRDPMAMEIDENGVAYVLEIPAYNEHGKPGPRTAGSIARLEDTDGDGRFDRRTTFAGDMKYPTGLFCYQGGLFVGDPPDLLYLRDTDGDGEADEREVLFTGFGAGPAGESQLNSFRWGLDNRIHICTGHDGGDIRRVERGRVVRGSPIVVRGSPDPARAETFGRSTGEVGRPAPNGDAPARNIRNRRMLLDPRTRTFELTSGGGQHGMSFDDWGRTFVCQNSNPIEMIFYDDRYIQRNPLMPAPEATQNIGPGANFTKVARISEPETWRRIRKRLLREGVAVTDTYEWDRAPGVFTSATGITIYRGDAWPEEFRGNAFIGEVVNNCVHRARLKTDGLSTISECVDPDVEFLASTDTWFRPVQFAHGPDGCLYVLDMYRQLIEGVQWVPQEVLAQMDVTAGSDRGRIYRIVPPGFKLPPLVRMGDMPIESLVGELAHPNGWRRDTAARLIYERQDRKAVKPLRQLLADSSFPQGRLHALYALDGLSSLEADDVLCGLADEHPRVREHAIRLAERFLVVRGSPDPARGGTVARPATTPSPEVRQKLVELTDDSDVAVRFQLAFSLGSLPAAERDHALVELLHRDGADSWFRMAIQSSLGQGAEEVFGRVLADAELRLSPHAQEFLAALATQVGRGQKSDEIAAAAAAIDQLDDDDQSGTLTKNLILALLADGAGASATELIDHSQGRVKETVTQLLSGARTKALDQNEPSDSRLEAITILGCGSFAAQRSAFDELLEPRQPQPIQEAVLKTLSRFSDAAVVELLLAKWPALTPNLRASAAEVLLSRPAWAESLLSAVEKNEIARGDFDPARVALLQSHPSDMLRARAATVFSDTPVARRADVVTNYRRSLELAGDAQRGRAVFQKSCAACHELEGDGTGIGADLRAIRDRGRETVLLNILDPNLEVQPRFVSYLVATVDGRVITGIITEETPNNVTIRQPDGAAVPIARMDIEDMKSTSLSYMPEGLETQIDHQSMADLLAFIGEEQEAASGE